MTQIANIIKQWHSIQQVFDLMTEQQSQQYNRVAMIRSDVFYLTPIDIWDTARPGVADVSNQVVVVPDFAKYPVNDRLIYGPYQAVKRWATTRFASIENHVHWVEQNKPGYGMHPETFVNRLLEQIQEIDGNQVQRHETMCFFRVRADESIWVNDCSQEAPFAGPKVQKNLPLDVKGAIEAILGRTCIGEPQPVAPETAAIALHCPLNPIPPYDDEVR